MSFFNNKLSLSQLLRRRRQQPAKVIPLKDLEVILGASGQDLASLMATAATIRAQHEKLATDLQTEGMNIQSAAEIAFAEAVAQAEEAKNTAMAEATGLYQESQQNLAEAYVLANALEVIGTTAE